MRSDFKLVLLVTLVMVSLGLSAFGAAYAAPHIYVGRFARAFGMSAASATPEVSATPEATESPEVRASPEATEKPDMKEMDDQNEMDDKDENSQLNQNSQWQGSRDGGGRDGAGTQVQGGGDSLSPWAMMGWRY